MPWWQGPAHDLHFPYKSLLPPWLFFDCLILKIETLHPSIRQAKNTAVRTSDCAVVRRVWHIICTVNKALCILEKPHRMSVLFAFYPDCSLKVSVHPEGPSTGYLATVFSWFYCLDTNPKAVSEFEFLTNCFPCSRPDLNSSNSNSLLKKIWNEDTVN